MGSGDWVPIEMELVHGDNLLRVRRTTSPHRFRWFVVPLAEVKKTPYWFGPEGKGSSRALAAGYSKTFEAAMRDVIKMADVVALSERAELEKKNA